MGKTINYSRSEVSKIIMLLIACLLGLVLQSRAQIVGNGPCPHVAPMQNFQVEKAMGLWYEWARVDNPVESGSICTNVNFHLADDGTVPTTINSVLEYSGWKVSWDGKCSFVNGSSSSGIYKCENPRNALIRGRPIQYTLMADYDHFKISYACVMTDDIYAQFFWILSRTPDLDDKYQAEAADFLKKIGVPMDKITMVQQHDCN